MKAENGIKYCPSCEQNKEIIFFNKNKAKLDGLSLYCKECIKKGIVVHHFNDKENINLVKEGFKFCARCKNKLSLDSFLKDSSKTIGYSSYCKKCYNEWKKGKRENPTIKSKYSTFKSLAKYNNHLVEIDIGLYEKLINDKCTYCGSLKNIGIDRIDSDKGYIVGNVTSCCSICNRMKMDHSIEKFKEHIIKIYNYLCN